MRTLPWAVVGLLERAWGSCSYLGAVARHLTRRHAFDHYAFRPNRAGAGRHRP